MKTSIYSIVSETFVPVLQALSGILAKGAAHAEATGLAPETLANARLAPDMFPLNYQIQLSCFHAQDAVARLTGQEPAKRGNEELSLSGLKTLLDLTISGLSDLNAAAFEGAEDRVIEMPMMAQAAFVSDGFQYLVHWSLPNFYFHVVTAYDILRNAGVAIGKRDFMTHAMPFIVHKG